MLAVTISRRISLTLPPHMDERFRRHIKPNEEQNAAIRRLLLLGMKAAELADPDSFSDPDTPDDGRKRRKVV